MDLEFFTALFFVFLVGQGGTITFSPSSAGDIEDLCEVTETTEFLQAAIDHVYDAVPSEIPYRHFQFVGIEGDGIYFALFSLFFGLYWFFARRKDRLLVTYHRRLVELGELEDSDEH